MRFRYVTLLLLLASLLLVACGGDSGPQQLPTAVPEIQTETETEAEEAPAVDEEAEEEAEAPMADGMVVLPEVDVLAVSGNIVTAGSSTVFPLTERMAERFQEEGYSDQITIDSIGSGAGLQRFCDAGESDIANASRAINEGEIAQCEAIGRTPLEFRIGTDALAVVVSSENDFANEMTMEQVALAFSTAETWADVNPDWPAEPILRFIPGTDSGTFDYFVEEVFDEDIEPILSASNLQLSEDDNVLVQGVQGSPYAIAFFGYAYYEENADTLRVLTIEGVEANAGNVENGTYPLARPLFIYSTGDIMQQKPQVADFINFYLTFVNEEVIGVGYFPASEAAIEQAKTNWLVGMGDMPMSAYAATYTQAAPVEEMEEEMEMEVGIMADGTAVLPAVNVLEVSGNIVTAGSSTVFPLTERMAERFQEEGYSDQITIDSIGSGAGLQRFCDAGESDIANASRAINEGEIAQCEAIGRSPIEFRVGTDALAVVVSSENDFATEMTLEEVALAFSTAETWADVNPDWPAEPILRFIPGTDSGTFDYFVEEVFDEDIEPILSASNLQLSEDDNVLVQGVQGSPYAIAFFGYAYYEENQDTLTVLDIEGVTASAEAVEDGSYPLARPLFIYSTASIMEQKPQVADFINFYLTFVNEEVVGVGYFPASEAALSVAKQNWLDAMGQ